MTQMEAISARQSFPSFDEPRFKTPFNIRLTIPSKYSGLPIPNKHLSKQRSRVGKHSVLHKPNHYQLIYLHWLSDHGNYKGPDIGATSWRKQPIQLRGIAPDTKAEKMQHALSETPAILKL